MTDQYDYDFENEQAQGFDNKFERDWHNPRSQAKHTCKGCQTTFHAHNSRGPLAYCDSCADAIESGLGPYPE